MNLFASKWMKYCEYLPPLVRFCDAIVGRIIPPREFGASGSESLCDQFKRYFNSCVFSNINNLIKNNLSKNLTAWFSVPLDTLLVPIPCDDILFDRVLFRFAATRFELIVVRLLAIGLYECELCDLKPMNERQIRRIQWKNNVNHQIGFGVNKTRFWWCYAKFWHHRLTLTLTVTWSYFKKKKLIYYVKQILID